MEGVELQSDERRVESRCCLWCTLHSGAPSSVSSYECGWSFVLHVPHRKQSMW